MFNLAGCTINRGGAPSILNVILAFAIVKFDISMSSLMQNGNVNVKF